MSDFAKHTRDAAVDLRDNVRGAELLLRLWNAGDRASGIAVIDLPEPLRDDALLTAVSTAGLIEFGRRKHCHSGGGKNSKLLLEDGWDFASLNDRGKKRVHELLREALTEQVPQEIRHHVRLSAKGEAEASRLQLSRDANAKYQFAKAEFPSSEGRPELEKLVAAFEHFNATLGATTVPASDDARRVAGFAHAVALSEASDALSAELSAASQQLFREHGSAISDMSAAVRLEESESPAGPRKLIPSDRVSIKGMQIGGDGADAMLMSALESASRVVSFSIEAWNTAQARNPGANHQRWQPGDLIGADELAELKCANNLLKLFQRGQGTEESVIADARAGKATTAEAGAGGEKPIADRSPKKAPATTGENRARANRKKKPLPKARNGPKLPNIFVWNGKPHKLTPQFCQIVKCVWSKKSVPIDDVIETVWGERLIREKSFASAVSKITGRFEELGLPIRLNIKAGYLTITIERLA